MPAPRKRPGGLIFLAVLQFAFAACWAIAIGVLQFVIRAQRDPTILPPGLEERTVQVLHAAMTLPAWFLWERVIGGVAKILLWLTSGVAYLKLMRIGRYLGSAYAVLSIAEGVLGVVIGSPVVAELIGCLFPTVLLIMLNSRLIFRDVLVERTFG